MRPSQSLCAAAVLISLFHLGSPAPGGAQPAVRVADLNTTRENLASYIFVNQPFMTLGTEVVFGHDDTIHGLELWRTDGTAGGTVLLKDICPGACWSFPRGATVWNGVLYFGADDGVHGIELWRTDGTPAGTRMVVDLNPGLPGSFGSLLVVGGTLYLAADDGVHGRELWRTDGTAAGTQMVADLRPGAAGSDPRLWLDLGGTLLLSADDGVHGREPWTSDGTATGTAMLADLNPGAASSTLAQYTFLADALALPGGGFLFQADDGTHGIEPWISDGTAAGTHLLTDLYPGADSSFPEAFTTFGGRILFRANDGVHGIEPWATDLTAAGTVQVADVYPGSGSSAPMELTTFGGKAYFQASDPTAGRELWSTDGSAAGTGLVKDLNPGTAFAFTPFLRHPMVTAAGALYFFADDGTHGGELWKSDGTAAGTAMVKDAWPGSGWGYGFGYTGIAVLGGRLFYHGQGPDGFEPWTSDGTAAGTFEIENVDSAASGVPVAGGYPWQPFADLGNGRLLFLGQDGVTGTEPWTSDGTAAGTQLLVDTSPGAADTNGYPWVHPFGGTILLSGTGLWTTDGTAAGTVRLVPEATLPNVEGFTDALGWAFFSGGPLHMSGTLWKTDGTAAGTVPVTDHGTPVQVAGGMVPLGTGLVFVGSDGPNGAEPWRTDGTSTGTSRLADLDPGTSGSYPQDLTVLGSRVVFSADGGPTAGREVYTSDGTPTGTVRLRDIRPGTGSSEPTGFVRLGGAVVFAADDGVHGYELWRTDGTPAGTVPVVDLLPGAGSGLLYPYSLPLYLLGGAAYFVGDDGAAGAELWRTDGTAAGTVRVADVRPGPLSSQISDLTVAGGRLFFVADDGVHGRELWTTDGTAAGTRLVRDVVPGSGSPALQQLAAIGHLLLFSADDGVHGRELWRSDGGAAGTFLVQDAAPGAAPSSPTGFTAAGDGVFFAADDGPSGFELWRAPRAALLTTFSDVPPTFWAWRFIEGLAGAGLTSGCGGGRYCPGQALTRAQTAVMLIGAEHGASYVPPPATGTRFSDVPATYWAAPWIEQLAAEGIAGGCGGGRFCPNDNVSRAQMAVLLIGAEHGSGYVPPPATGTRFSDVPATYWAAPWIEQLAAEGITNGCGGGRYCPADEVHRDEIAVFLSAAFHLPLP